MAIDFRRKEDVKLLVGAAVAVLLAAGFIAGVLLVVGGGSNPVCGRLKLLAVDVRSRAELGPDFRTGGGDCGFWLALDNGDIVAYKAVQPSGCTLNWKGDHWQCGHRTLQPEDLAQYPVSIQTLSDGDAVIVDLRAPQPSVTSPPT